MPFYRDSKGQLIGQFHLQSMVPENYKALVAFYITTSSKVPFKIKPKCGFVRPGQLQQIAFMWPNNTKYDLDQLPLTTF